MNFYLRCFLLIVVLTAAKASFAEDGERDYLLGDWGGKRAELEAAGVTLEAILTNDLIANTSGGIRRTAGVLGNTDLTFTVDTAQAGMWEGGTIFLYALGNYGKSPSSYIGELQVADNIETYGTVKMYEAWYSHTFAEGTLNLLAGLHDYNSEFNSLEYAGNLLNSSFGISVDIAQVGPSIFSTTSLAFRAKYQPSESWYINTAIYDGVPGDPNNPRGTRIKHPSSDGYFYAIESGLVGPEGNGYHKVALGGWIHTAEYEDFSGVTRDINSGMYFIGESRIYDESDSDQGLGLFFQSGFARSDRNQIGNYFGAGLSYQGLIPGRDSDNTSLGAAMARNGADYRDANPGVDKAETAVEFSYRAELTPYFALQPDLQYIINPGTDPHLDHAVVLGIRTEVRL